MEPWQIWIDTGGTFTDVLALDPEGQLRRVKVLSSSALRATALGASRDSGSQSGEAIGQTLRYEAPFSLPSGFADGASLFWLGDEADGQPRSAKVLNSPPGLLDLDVDLELHAEGRAFELRFDEEAPILAARLITGSSSVDALPPLRLRLATTRGTNALLERRGARTVLFITRGFSDLLEIGDQQRPDLFALHIERPEPLQTHVIEVSARRGADGSLLEELDLEALSTQLDIAAEEFESAAISLMHSYLHADEELALEQALRERGLRYISTSAALSPVEGYLARTRTAVVDAYLQPVIGRYLERIRAAIGDSQLKVMTSAGGLVAAPAYRAKDSLLSGPAGGVVGAATAAARLGFERLIAFDMGGTSTDVSRFDGDFDYRFEQRVGDARISAPTLAIETVAAGGGSICQLQGRQLKVGPESAGASPGPACYGAGGPLTLTDVNLLLGRLDEERFEIPLDRAAAEKALDVQLEALGSLSAEQLLLGYVAIANQRMADAVRQISVRQGYDPRDHALVAFGGAGGQHACAVADLIGIKTVMLPPDAGLLSAFGLGAAVMERFATRQLLRPLAEIAKSLPELVADLALRAKLELEKEGVRDSVVRRRLAFVRVAGQESTLEIELPDGADLAESSNVEAIVSARFREAWRLRYGYQPRDPELEIESLRVVASEGRPAPARVDPAPTAAVEPAALRPVIFEKRSLPAAVHWLPDVPDGAVLESPALLFDQHASFTLLPGWRAERQGGAVVARRLETDSGLASES